MATNIAMEIPIKSEVTTETYSADLSLNRIQSKSSAVIDQIKALQYQATEEMKVLISKVLHGDKKLKEADEKYNQAIKTIELLQSQLKLAQEQNSKLSQDKKNLAEELSTFQVNHSDFLIKLKNISKFPEISHTDDPIQDILQHIETIISTSKQNGRKVEDFDNWLDKMGYQKTSSAAAPTTQNFVRDNPSSSKRSRKKLKAKPTSKPMKTTKICVAGNLSIRQTYSNPDRADQSILVTKIATFPKQVFKETSSSEQQLKFDNLLKDCFGMDECRRKAGVHQLSQECQLKEFPTKFCDYVVNKIKWCSMPGYDLKGLVYLMRMVKNFLENDSINFRKYLHQNILPETLKLMSSKESCTCVESESHWILRDLASRMLLDLYNKFTSVQISKPNSYLEPIISLKVLHDIIAGLGDLGMDEIMDFIIPQITIFGTWVESRLNVESERKEEDSIAAEKIKELLLKHVSPVLLSMILPQNTVQAYNAEFGYFGEIFYGQVNQL